jgi:putative spermidine/putrescine transport system permease protein
VTADAARTRSYGGSRPPGRRNGAAIRATLGRSMTKLALAVIVALIALPSLIVMVTSFGTDPFIKFPPSSWGFARYESVFNPNHVWYGDLLRSLEVASIVAVIAVVIGSMFVFATQRSRLPRIPGLDLLVLAPLVVPSVTFVLALYLLFSKLHLVGSLWGVVLAHVVLAVPLVVLVLGSALSRVPRNLEEAALSLGANRTRTAFDVTLRLLWPAVGAAAVFAFITSFDEVVFVSFLAGPDFKTLPLEIFESLQFGVDPAITAIATLLSLSAALLLGLLTWLQRLQEKVA